MLALLYIVNQTKQVAKAAKGRKDIPAIERKLKKEVDREMKGETMDGSKGPVVVTGASGFVGSWLVMKLLQAGYTVRATVRDPGERSLRPRLRLSRARELTHEYTTDEVA